MVKKKAPIVKDTHVVRQLQTETGAVFTLTHKMLKPFAAAARVDIEAGFVARVTDVNKGSVQPRAIADLNEAWWKGYELARRQELEA